MLGYLDDLLIVPAGIWLALRLIPPELMTELRAAAEAQGRPRSLAGAAAVVAIWLGAVALFCWFWLGR